jgi:nitroreductase
MPTWFLSIYRSIYLLIAIIVGFLASFLNYLPTAPHPPQRTASSFNLQPTQIIMVTSQAAKDKVTEAMLGPGNQFRTQQCSALAVFLSDLEAGKRIQRIHQLETDWGKRPPAYMAMMPLTTSYLLGEGHAATLLKQLAGSFLSEIQPMPQQEPIQSWCYKNTALAAQSYVLAAESHDLGTSMMEGMDTRRLKEVLRIPDRYAIPIVIATGYDYENETDESTLTPRLPLEELVFQDSFGVPYVDPAESFQDEDDDRVASV